MGSTEALNRLFTRFLLDGLYVGFETNEDSSDNACIGVRISTDYSKVNQSGISNICQLSYQQMRNSVKVVDIEKDETHELAARLPPRLTFNDNQTAPAATLGQGVTQNPDVAWNQFIRGIMGSVDSDLMADIGDGEEDDEDDDEDDDEYSPNTNRPATQNRASGWRMDRDAFVELNGGQTFKVNFNFGDRPVPGPGSGSGARGGG